MATCEFSGTCSFFKEEFEGIPHIANLLHKAFCNIRRRNLWIPALPSIQQNI
jgi:hypothetical protein